MRKRTWSPAFALVVFALLATLCGCSQSGPDMIRVHGKITFDGSAPPADGSLNFMPIQPAQGQPTRPGRANFTQGDGTFTVTTVRPDDGLVPGTYSVEIICWKRRPTETVDGISYVPKGYSPPDLEIKADQSGPIEYNLQVPPK